MEHVFYDLDAPVARVCGVEVPIPYPKHLEDAALPQVPAIIDAVRQLVPAKQPDPASGDLSRRTVRANAETMPHG
jgi:hypothetical protein